MSDRPPLETGLDGKTFRSFYYLKEELIAFCRQVGLQTAGAKIDLTDRIAHFLDTGEKPSVGGKSDKKKPAANLTITGDTLIEENIICSETHRAFFKERIGAKFSFKVVFQKWLKENSGKTYNEAVEAYYAILENEKRSTTVIDKQFEYNTYIRDFFNDNKGKLLNEAIQCWNYKKGIKGHNRYEKSDLIALDLSYLR